MAAEITAEQAAVDGMKNQFDGLLTSQMANSQGEAASASRMLEAAAAAASTPVAYIEENSASDTDGALLRERLRLNAERRALARRAAAAAAAARLRLRLRGGAAARDRMAARTEKRVNAQAFGLKDAVARLKDAQDRMAAIM